LLGQTMAETELASTSRERTMASEEEEGPREIEDEETFKSASWKVRMVKPLPGESHSK
jgi:hypothetical protein